MFRPHKFFATLALTVSFLSPNAAQSSTASHFSATANMAQRAPISQTARVRPSASELFALWNGFLDQINILELGNTRFDRIAVRVELFRLDGSLGTSLLVSIPEGEQRDIIVNDLPGFSRNAYGIIRLTFLSGFEEGAANPNDESSYSYQAYSDVVDARLSFYKTGKDDTYDFAFSLPLLDRDSNGATSVVAFNTFQPSNDIADAGNVVANWLTIINLNSFKARFAIESYKVDGTPLPTRTVEISAFGRVDLEAGHENPGPSNVGLHLVRSLDEAADEDDGCQIVQLTRYGYRKDGSIAFAFPLQAVSYSNDYSSLTDTDDVVVPVSTMLTAQNWLELANTESTVSTLDLELFDADGALKHSQKVVLAAHAQNHININQYLGEARTGHAVLSNMSASDEYGPFKPRIVAQSMHYFRNAKGGIDTIYGAEALPLSAPYNSTSGSYNLFLGMSNWLKIFNRAEFIGEFTVVVHHEGGDKTRRTVTVPANGSIDVPIHDSDLFSTQSNTYGVVEVHPQVWFADFGPDVFGPYMYSTQLLRVRMSGTNTVDFIAPISVCSTEGGEF